MSFDSILMFVGVIIAILAIIPRAKLLLIKIKVSWFDIALMVICCVIILYLLFINSFLVFGVSPGWNLHKWKITPSNSIFLILLSLSFYLLIRYNCFSFSIRKINKVGRLIDNMIQEGKYNDLIDFLDKNFKRLNDITNRKTWYLKFRDRAKIKRYPRLEKFFNEETISLKDRFINFLILPLRILPSFDKCSSESENIISRIVLNEDFIEFIVKSHSYIFLKFFDINRYYQSDFVNLIFRKLLSNNRSILYTELENTQNLNHYSNYWIIDENKLIYFLFNDPTKAEKLAIWQPIGEYFIEKMGYLHRHPELDNFNTNIQNYYESSRWKSDVFIAIHFFDVMVSQALYKNIQWHMRLYYYNYFVEEILKNHKNTDMFYDPNDEWPTKYEYLIYQIFSNMENWIKSLDEIDINQENVKIENTHLTHNNGNIPVSAIITIGLSLKSLFESTTISSKFKYYIFSMIFELYFYLRNQESLLDYSILLAKAIFYKIEMTYQDLEDYYSFLDESFEKHFDKAPIQFERLTEFRNILANRGNNL